MYIVWNAAKNEGFVTDDHADAVTASTGEHNGNHSTLAMAFFECYEDETPLTIEQVNIVALDADGWIVWNGESSTCPVDADTMIDVRFRCDATVKAASARGWDWKHHDTDNSHDIVAYRVCA